MNNDRRKALAAVQAKWEEAIEALAAHKSTLEDIKEELEGLRDEEQEYYNNMPESLQGGEKGQAAEGHGPGP